MQQETLEKVKDTIVEETTSILDFKFIFSEEISITVRGLLFVVVALVVTSFVLKLFRKFITRNMPNNDKLKFVTVFGYIRWIVFLIIFLIAMHTSGVNVTAVFAASAALLIGVGLALQTLFQDIFSGIIILVDQSVHVGDIIELEGKVGRVLDIRLRTTRAVTIDNKVLVIPNHLYLTNILFNWTENGTETRESVDVGVAYGSDVELVKKILLEVATAQPTVLENPAPVVLFTDFADSSLNFKVAFTLNNSFEVRFTQSNIRFEIDKAFRENNITIPFPQRDVHMFSEK
ncbi:mechanosensitive ion channel family protein [Polaribacter dokdonensis]|uniref:Mechanosensitive ion channel n=1 Tax=Polaribacter dokdonensis DSW-5 TaxID=1300348 RepID=A0A0M9CDR1_9FLAO|nr:mechanosensitive ion channel domain-containing protein [Polaribacter dokdonensis]KOY50581.1 Small-conductance mechanosensitive channel [Polaribacter dokdonensis DSW-5]SEE61084.1 Mechanosensitive ion channel [Polaribacter dokdonensis DSW-5]